MYANYFNNGYRPPEAQYHFRCWLKAINAIWYCVSDLMLKQSFAERMKWMEWKAKWDKMNLISNTVYLFRRTIDIPRIAPHFILCFSIFFFISNQNMHDNIENDIIQFVFDSKRKPKKTKNTKFQTRLYSNKNINFG